MPIYRYHCERIIEVEAKEEHIAAQYVTHELCREQYIDGGVDGVTVHCYGEKVTKED